MKKQKSVFFLCISLAVLLAFFGFFIRQQPRWIFRQNKAALEAVIAEYEQTGTFSVPELPGIKTANVWGTDPFIVEFCTGGFGLAPASVYRGFYYSQNGKPAAFQNGPQTLVPTKDGWEWSGPGDNGGTTQHLEGSWFLFQAHF